MGSPHKRERLTLPDGRSLTYRVPMLSDSYGRPMVDGKPCDGWCDGWPLTDDELAQLLGKG